MSQIAQHALLVHGKEKALGGLDFQIGKIPFQKGLANLGRLIGAGFDAVEGAEIERDVKQGVAVANGEVKVAQGTHGQTFDALGMAV